MKKMEGFTLRFAEETDTKLVLDLIKELAGYEKMADEVVATEELIKENVFKRKIAEVVIAEFDGVPIGYAMYFYKFSSFAGKPAIYLEDLYINSMYRGRGFGKAIFTFLAELAIKHDCWGLEWTCLNWNKPSIAFYESIGAIHWEEWRIYRLLGNALEEMASKN
jgi:GNAT superfamily N-acetyltransferase